MTAAGNEAEIAHPVQEDFDFLLIFFLFFYFLLACNFEVLSFILVLENKRINK